MYLGQLPAVWVRHVSDTQPDSTLPSGWAFWFISFRGSEMLSRCFACAAVLTLSVRLFLVGFSTSLLLIRQTNG
ncbi:hypothetical protein AOLI_G00225800 [Acnodon oligacanthus]